MLAIADNLKNLLKGKVLILGVGNRMKGDDGAGPAVVDKIAGRISADCFDAGVAPENYLEKVAGLKPDTVLLVDAVSFGGKPGEIRLIAPEQIVAGGLSTHVPSLQMAAEYLKARISATTLIAGIQPESLKLGDGLSEAVSKAVDSLADALLEVLGRK